MSRRNADHKDPSHQVEVRHHYRAGGASAWKRAEQQGQQRLFKMNAAKRGRGGRRRNSASEADQLHETFLGRPTDEVITMRTPAGTPKHITGLGQLLKIHTDKQTLIFDERDGYTLCADPSEGLHIGSRCDERFEALADLGEIRRITYAATKNHLDNRPVEYFHDTEPTRPRLTTDKDGLLLIEGGDYSISAAGIEG